MILYSILFTLSVKTAISPPPPPPPPASMALFKSFIFCVSVLVLSKYVPVNEFLSPITSSNAAKSLATVCVTPSSIVPNGVFLIV